MKVIIMKGKHGDYMVDASTPEKEQAAFLYLFNINDENGFYKYEYESLDCLKDLEERCEEVYNTIALYQNKEIFNSLPDNCRREIIKLLEEQLYVRKIYGENLEEKFEELLKRTGGKRVRTRILEEIEQLKENREDYEKAKKGSYKAAKDILNMRSCYEYEKWNYDFITDPIEENKKRAEEAKSEKSE